MKTADELKELARHEIDTPGHPDYGKAIFTFTESKLDDYVTQLRAEGLDKLMFDFFKGSGFDRLAEAQQTEAARQREIQRNKEIREKYDYLKWRQERKLDLTAQQLAELEFCIFKIEGDLKKN
jgi:hypothetical protein